MAIADVVKLFDQFKKAYDAGDKQLETAQKLMSQLKIAILDFTSLVCIKPNLCLGSALLPCWTERSAVCQPDTCAAPALGLL